MSHYYPPGYLPAGFPTTGSWYHERFHQSVGDYLATQETFENRPRTKSSTALAEEMPRKHKSDQTEYPALFFKLPAELRTVIYHLVVPPRPTTLSHCESWMKRQVSDTSLLALNRQINAEAAGLLFAPETEFQLIISLGLKPAAYIYRQGSVIADGVDRFEIKIMFNGREVGCRTSRGPLGRPRNTTTTVDWPALLKKVRNLSLHLSVVDLHSYYGAQYHRLPRLAAVGRHPDQDDMKAANLARRARDPQVVETQNVRDLNYVLKDLYAFLRYADLYKFSIHVATPFTPPQMRMETAMHKVVSSLYALAALARDTSFECKDGGNMMYLHPDWVQDCVKALQIYNQRVNEVELCRKVMTMLSLPMKILPELTPWETDMGKGETQCQYCIKPHAALYAMARVGERWLDEHIVDMRLERGLSSFLEQWVELVKVCVKRRVGNGEKGAVGADHDARMSDAAE